MREQADRISILDAKAWCADDSHSETVAQVGAILVLPPNQRKEYREGTIARAVAEHIGKMESELEALRADARRLKWHSENPNVIHFTSPDMSNKNWRLSMPGYLPSRHLTLSDAIDAGIAQSGQDAALAARKES